MTKRRRAQIRVFLALITPAVTAYCTFLTEAATVEGAMASAILNTLAAVGLLVEESPMPSRRPGP